jgi:hypothetical protein
MLEALPAPPRTELERHVRRALKRYWAADEQPLALLPTFERPFPHRVGALELAPVALPPWAAPCGVEGILLVPLDACEDALAPTWSRVDWWLAAFLLLEGWHERAWERAHGTIHSYSARLHGFDERLWARAWVNRIGLFLRAWSAHEGGRAADSLFGVLPEPEIVLTHDVDAVAKTLSIRFKQAAFLSFNAMRQSVGAPGAGAARMWQAMRFLLRSSNWWMFEMLLQLEHNAGVRSRFHFYADDRPKTPVRWLFDPGYDVAHPRIVALLERLVRSGHSVGLHQSHDAWHSYERMRSQRERLQAHIPTEVTSCRQHWLRFSWAQTWAAQEAAGFRQDSTLMFNDRAGLRTGAALSWSPWNARAGKAHTLQALPTMLMDSHLYDYRMLAAEERRATMRALLDEVVAVAGQAAVLWHPHTLSDDYGWLEGFEELLAAMQASTRCMAS